MKYPGDTYTFVFPVPGTSPTVTATPQVTVIDASNGTAVVSSQAMNLIAGSNAVYLYNWNTTGTGNGTYVALVSYAVSGTAVNGVFLEKLQLGDSRITGVVALDATVAKDSTVAHDASVFKKTDFVTPSQDASIQAILGFTQNIPAAPATAAAVSALVSMLTDVHDFALGNWIGNKVNNTLTLYRIGGGVLKVFNAVEDVTQSSRVAST
jgi:hypothetical protein